MTLLEFLRTAEPDAIALELFRMQTTAVAARRILEDSSKIVFETSLLAATIEGLKRELAPGLDGPQFQLLMILAKKMVEEKERETG